jgi:hypothetical protein
MRTLEVNHAACIGFCQREVTRITAKHFLRMNRLVPLNQQQAPGSRQFEKQVDVRTHLLLNMPLVVQPGRVIAGHKCGFRSTCHT